MVCGSNIVHAISPQQPNQQWSTRTLQCSEPSTTDDCLCGFFCCPCAYATAKSTADKSSACYNFLCWNAVASRSYIRREYNIVGVCGDDIGYTIFCPCCTARQAKAESTIRGFSKMPSSLTYGANNSQWSNSLFACECCSCLQALVCPCYMASQVRVVLQPNAASDGCLNCCCICPTSIYGLVRHDYGIVSATPDCTCCEDVLVALFCYPCALIRARNETVVRQPLSSAMAMVKQLVK